MVYLPQAHGVLRAGSSRLLLFLEVGRDREVGGATVVATSRNSCWVREDRRACLRLFRFLDLPREHAAEAAAAAASWLAVCCSAELAFDFTASKVVIVASGVALQLVALLLACARSPC